MRRKKKTVSQNLVIAGAPTTKSRDTSWREIPGHFALKAPERKSHGDAECENRECEFERRR